eukprot:jgi/Botrbrau1/21525/Bobra.174_2s0028.1
MSCHVVGIQGRGVLARTPGQLSVRAVREKLGPAVRKGALGTRKLLEMGKRKLLESGEEEIVGELGRGDCWRVGKRRLFDS